MLSHRPRWRNALTAAVIGGLRVLFLVIQFLGATVNPALVKLSGREGLLDLKLYDTAQQAFTMLDRYGAVGRALCFRFLAAAVVFIPVYSLGFAFLLARILRKLCAVDSAWRLLSLLPLGIGGFDIIENSTMLSMRLLYPHGSGAIDALAGGRYAVRPIESGLLRLGLGLRNTASMKTQR